MIRAGNSENLAKIFREARERLFEKGWRKDEFGGFAGPNCILGAVMCSKEGFEGRDLPIIENVLNALVDEMYEDVVAFNDDSETTFSDIVDLLDLAIKNLENEQCH